jgi:hypothetical protein
MMNLPKPGDRVDVRVLRNLRQTQRINIYLYMDEEIAKTSDIAADIAKYRLVDPDFRPMMEIEEWFKTMQKQMYQIVGTGADVELMFAEAPLHADILELSEMQTAVGPCPCIKALLPYLDEMEEISYSSATMPCK